MTLINRLFKYLALFFLSIFFISCGYKPMAHYANRALGDKIYVKLDLHLENTEESVQIKDIINEAIASRFYSRLVSEDESDTILNVKIMRMQDSVIATNSQGFATYYRIYMDIKFSFNHNGKEVVFVNPGFYDYASVLDNPLATYNNRINAIIEASKQSIDRFISQVAYSVVF